MYWTFRLRVCPTGYPYFDSSTLLCYDICPNGKYPDIPTLQCLPCLYSCVTCSSYSVCTNCSSTDFRVLIANNCPPIPGYYDNSTSTAVPCSVSVANCTDCYLSGSSVVCITCGSEYYADPVTGGCIICPFGCANCISATMCTVCISGYVYDGLSACTLSNCNDVNCIGCLTNSAICDSCASGYVVSSNSTCITKCGDSILISP